MDYKELDDSKLLYMIRENDEESFNSLYKKYLPYIYAYAITKKYVNLRISFEDIYASAQDGLVVAIRTYSFQKDTIFSTHLHTCLQSRFCNLFRFKYSKKRNVNSDYEGDTEKLPDLKDNVTPLMIMIDLEFEDKVIKFKNELKDMQGAIFELRYNEFKMYEIAQLLNISFKKVESNLKKIKEELKIYLEKVEKI